MKEIRRVFLATSFILMMGSVSASAPKVTECLLMTAYPTLIHTKFAQRRILPEKNGDTIVFRRYSKLDTVPIPLVDGRTPPGAPLSAELSDFCIGQEPVVDLHPPNRSFESTVTSRLIPDDEGIGDSPRVEVIAQLVHRSDLEAIDPHGRLSIADPHRDRLVHTGS